MTTTAMGKRVGHDTTRFIFELHAPDFHVPQDVQRWFEDKARARLDKYARWVERVRVFVRDVNGSKRGVDQQVHIDCHLARLEPVEVVETSHDLRAAMDLSLDRLELALASHLEKRMTKRLEKGRKMVRNRKLATS